MQANLGMLIDSLGAKFSIDIYAKNWLDVEISELQVLKKKPESMSPDTLYICDSRLVFELSVNHTINVICYNSALISYTPKPGNINLFVVCGNVSENALLNAVVDCLINKSVRTFPPELAHNLLNCMDLNTFCSYVEDFIGNPTMIANTDGVVISCSKTLMTEDKYWKEACSLFMADPDSNEARIWTRALIQSNCNGRAIFQMILNHRYIFCPIINNNTVIGFICVPEFLRTMGQMDLERIELIRALFMQRLLTLHGDTSSLMDAKEHLVTFLLSRTEISPIRLMIMQEKIGFSFPEELIYCAVIRFNKIDCPRNEFALVRSAIPSPFSEYCVYYRNDIVILINVPRPFFHTEEQLKPLLDILKNHDVSVGLSRPYHQIQLTADGYQQALDALKYGMLFYSENLLHTYEQTALFSLFESCPDQDAIINLCHRGILHLKDLDEINGTSYLKTFRHYILNGRSLRQTADSLFIHRNTVSYHVSKCLDILNIDLNDGDQLFQITLSLKIADYLTQQGKNSYVPLAQKAIGTNTENDIM